MVAEVTPVGQRGAMLGINNAVATTAGIFAPIVMGMVVDVGTNTADGFRTGFMIAGVLVVVGALIGLLLINPEADIRRFAERGAAPLRPLAAKA
jgi:MFS family permease